MPTRRHRRGSRVPVREIDGECSRSLDLYKDAANRNFVVVKFSMIKTLKEDEAGFHLTGDACQLGNWKGHMRSRECPANSGHHVVHASLPKDTCVSYRWVLVYADQRTAKEKECNRQVELTDSDITIQDCFGIYANLLTHIFHPDYHQEDQLLLPVLFRTNHKVADNSKQRVAVIGSTSDLGRWRALNALAMFEVEPDLWATIIYLPKGRKLRYKFVVIETSKYKRIMYGEKRDHRIMVDEVREGDDDDGAEAGRPESGHLNGIWSPAIESAISIEQVEEQSMGSVASDFTLGTKASLASRLSDITEDSPADVCGNTKEQEISKEQENLLQELKRELTTDYNAPSTSGQSTWLTEEDLARLDGSAVDPPPGRDQRCAEWLVHHEHTDSKEDLLWPLYIDEGELQPLLDKSQPKSLSWLDNRDPFDSTKDWTDITSALTSLDEVVGTDPPCKEIELKEMEQLKVEAPMVDMEEALEPPLEPEVENQPEPTSTCQKTPEFQVQQLSTPEPKINIAPTSASAPPRPEAPPRRIPVNEVKVNSCTSLKTSTVQLPCYRDKNASDADVARKIVDRLPWIKDLPRGLTCKVLNSVGILNKDRQRDVASELMKLN